MTEERREESELEEAPEGASEEARPDEDDIQDPSPEQQDPESGPAADDRQADI